MIRRRPGGVNRLPSPYLPVPTRKAAFLRLDVSVPAAWHRARGGRARPVIAATHWTLPPAFVPFALARLTPGLVASLLLAMGGLIGASERALAQTRTQPVPGTTLLLPPAASQITPPSFRPPLEKKADGIAVPEPP